MSLPQSNQQWAAGGDLSEITMIGEPILRSKANPADLDGETCRLAERMVLLLRKLNGAGLAAPQVGASKRVIVVEVRKTELFPHRPESPLFIMINPMIIRAINSSEEGWEGCFSIPNLMGKVPRSPSITVRYTKLEGDTVEESFDGYIARVIQHECDHLDGTIFLDRMTSTTTLTTVANYKRFHHNNA